MERIAEVPGVRQSRSLEESTDLDPNLNYDGFNDDGLNVRNADLVDNTNLLPEGQLGAVPAGCVVSPNNIQLPLHEAHFPWRDLDANDCSPIHRGNNGALPEADWGDWLDSWLTERGIDRDTECDIAFDAFYGSQLDFSNLVPYLRSHVYISSPILYSGYVSSREPTPVSTPVLTVGAHSQPSDRGSRSPLPISRNPITSRPSRPESAAKIHHCSYNCDISFASKKDCERHELLHQPGNEYACRCSYKTGRKDTFMRHLRRRKHLIVHDNYVCRCGTLFIDRNKFTQHISTCGVKPRGRPPKEPASTAVPVTSAAEWRG